MELVGGYKWRLLRSPTVIRAMLYPEKIILCAKADRSERAVLIQDNDPQLLYYLLKNRLH